LEVSDEVFLIRRTKLESMFPHLLGAEPLVGAASTADGQHRAFPAFRVAVGIGACAVLCPKFWVGDRLLFVDVADNRLRVAHVPPTLIELPFRSYYEALVCGGHTNTIEVASGVKAAWRNEAAATVRVNSEVGPVR